MPTQITEYKCPSCTAPLHFVGNSGKLECDYCGSSFDVSQVEALWAELNSETPQPEETSWDTPSEGWEEEPVLAYVCPSCGAELICEVTTAATRCPYCGNNAIVPGQLGGALKPDYVIPFKLDKQAAVEALKAHYRKKPFLPGTFSQNNHLEEVQGVYVPFWLFDGEAHADCLYHADRSFTRREGDYRVTTTEHFQVRRAGVVPFRCVPVDASRKMPDNYMDAMEPFDYSALTPFSTAYLPGYLADKYDISADESMGRADLRCTNSAKAAMFQDVMGYTNVIPVSEKVQLHRGKAHYALLPVWTLHTKWQGKDYLFMMNGQTGKLVGDLPVSKGKFWGTFGALSAVLSLLLFLTGAGQRIAAVFLG